jgi:hypothetical protein
MLVAALWLPGAAIELVAMHEVEDDHGISAGRSTRAAR